MMRSLVLRRTQHLLRWAVRCQDMSYPAPSAFSHASIFSGANFAAVVRFYQIVLNMRVKYVIKNKFHLYCLAAMERITDSP